MQSKARDVSIAVVTVLILALLSLSFIGFIPFVSALIAIIAMSIFFELIDVCFGRIDEGIDARISWSRIAWRSRLAIKVLILMFLLVVYLYFPVLRDF